MARNSASAPYSLRAEGRFSGLSSRMPFGTAASTIASSEEQPHVLSMAAMSSASGPMWREGKRSVQGRGLAAGERESVIFTKRRFVARRPSKIRRRPWATKEIEHGDEQQTVRQQLEWRVQDTEDHVVSQPDDSTPARPVPATEHERSANYREKPDKAYPEQLRIKRTLGFELGGVIGEPDDPSGDE